MGLDVNIRKFNKMYPTLDSIPDDAYTLPLGNRNKIKEIISSFFIGIDWVDLSGIYESADGSIVFVFANDSDDITPIYSFSLELRGVRGDDIYYRIVKMVKQNGWQAIEYAGSTFLDQDEELVRGAGFCFTD